MICLSSHNHGGVRAPPQQLRQTHRSNHILYTREEAPFCLPQIINKLFINFQKLKGSNHENAHIKKAL